jgi:hypothetical protein
VEFPIHFCLGYYKQIYAVFAFDSLPFNPQDTVFDDPSISEESLILVKKFPGVSTIFFFFQNTYLRFTHLVLEIGPHSFFFL